MFLKFKFESSEIKMDIIFKTEETSSTMSRRILLIQAYRKAICTYILDNLSVDMQQVPILTILKINNTVLVFQNEKKEQPWYAKNMFMYTKSLFLFGGLKTMKVVNKLYKLRKLLT